MATDEVSEPPSLPPYSEMILAAIAALDEKAGSSGAAISKYMETTYGELPDDHAALLTAALARMKDCGELTMAKNNYFRPESVTPAKRGRGRPPKPKEPLADDHVPSVPRPRGRPQKAKDPLADAVAEAAGGLPKPRGRPPKKSARTETAAAVPAASVAAAAQSPGGSVKRGRGRPSKVKPAADVAA